MENIDIKFLIAIPEEITNIIQGYDLDYTGKFKLMTHIIKYGEDLEIPQERIERYKKEYFEAHSLLELSKQKLQKEYIDPYVFSSIPYTWSLDYDTSIITVTIHEKN